MKSILCKKGDMMEEKLGKIVFDGRIYDLDNCEPEKLNKLLQDLKEEEKKLAKQIDEAMNADLADEED